MASSALKRWLRPEVYPLFAAVGVAVGICGMQLVRNISGNPEVRCDVEAKPSLKPYMSLRAVADPGILVTEGDQGK